MENRNVIALSLVEMAIGNILHVEKDAIELVEFIGIVKACDVKKIERISILGL